MICIVKIIRELNENHWRYSHTCILTNIQLMRSSPNILTPIQFCYFNSVSIIFSTGLIIGLVLVKDSRVYFDGKIVPIVTLRSRILKVTVTKQMNCVILQMLVVITRGQMENVVMQKSSYAKTLKVNIGLYILPPEWNKMGLKIYKHSICPWI